jgi:hypothetical protein
MFCYEVHVHKEPAQYRFGDTRAAEDLSGSQVEIRAYYEPPPWWKTIREGCPALADPRPSVAASHAARSHHSETHGSHVDFSPIDPGFNAFGAKLGRLQRTLPAITVFLLAFAALLLRRNGWPSDWGDILRSFTDAIYLSPLAIPIQLMLTALITWIVWWPLIKS